VAHRQPGQSRHRLDEAHPSDCTVRIPRCALGSPTTTPSFFGLFGTPIRMLTTGGLASDTVSLMLVEDSRSSGFCLPCFQHAASSYVPLESGPSRVFASSAGPFLSLPSPSFLPTSPLLFLPGHLPFCILWPRPKIGSQPTAHMLTCLSVSEASPARPPNQGSIIASPG
jgi:hypothetical protein